MTTVVDDILSHHGVKGMRWGIRRARGHAGVAPGQTRVTQKKPGKPLKAKGGKKIPAHEDAIAAETSRQRAKGSGTQALGNKELQALVNRMNLESQHSRLRRKSVGEQFVNELLDGLSRQGKKKK